MEQDIKRYLDQNWGTVLDESDRSVMAAGIVLALTATEPNPLHGAGAHRPTRDCFVCTSASLDEVPAGEGI